jgi:hypothetical protein
MTLKCGMKHRWLSLEKTGKSDKQKAPGNLIMAVPCLENRLRIFFLTFNMKLLFIAIP